MLLIPDSSGRVKMWSWSKFHFLFYGFMFDESGPAQSNVRSCSPSKSKTIMHVYLSSSDAVLWRLYPLKCSSPRWSLK